MRLEKRIKVAEAYLATPIKALSHFGDAQRKIADNLYHICSRPHPTNIVEQNAPFSR